MKIGLLYECSRSAEFSIYLCNSFRGAVVMRAQITVDACNYLNRGGCEFDSCSGQIRTTKYNLVRATLS